MAGTGSLEQLQLALRTMYSNGGNEIKQEANSFLETFQKSQDSWNVIFEVLNADGADQDSMMLKMFAAQTLRSKVNYDLHQIPRDALPGLKTSILNTVVQYEAQSKVILLQLCISLANFTLQFLEWDNALDEIFGFFSTSNCVTSLLQFLKVMPEELSDVKKTPLTDQEFNTRTRQLIDDNVEKVLILLTQFADSRAQNSNATNSLILDALNSWIAEIPIQQLLSIDSIASLIFQSVTEEDTFDTSVECLITVLKETKEIENMDIIKGIYQQLLSLRPFLNENKDDPERIDGLTRLFVEAGEAWHVLIARAPTDFKPLVEVLLELTAYDEDLDVVKYTFYFWYELKQMLMIEKFQPARQEFYDVYLKLIEIMIGHLQYPVIPNQDITDTAALFGGDLEQQDKFKDFRYDMGDVLKDCCAVVGATNALSIPYARIQEYIANPSKPWQTVEAPLFSLRSMAKEVSNKENKIMPSIMSSLIQLPENGKVRYAATLVLGRYTEWTAKHPDFLELQLNYITSGFSNTSDRDVLVAASHALLYFCQDCSSLLINYLEQLFQFYNNVAASLDVKSLYDVTEGISHILKEVDDEDKLFQITGMFWKPTLERLSSYENFDQHSDEIHTKVADEVEIITIYVKVLKPKTMNSKENAIANLIIQEVWPIVSKLINKFGHAMKCSERLTRLIKESIISFQFYMEPILPAIAEMLIKGFKRFNHGCYLWVSGILIRELSDSNDNIKSSIWQFSLQQSINFIQFLNEAEHNRTSLEFPDLIEDFFRMLGDMLNFYPVDFICNDELLAQVFEVSKLSLSTMINEEPLSATLHFLIDLIAWGLESPPISIFDIEEAKIQELRFKTVQFAQHVGENVIKLLLQGLVTSFPGNCSLDASDLITKLIRLQPDQKVAMTWLNNAVLALDNVSEKERLKLLGSAEVAVGNKDFRRVRSSIRDFVSWYLRKNIRSTDIL